MKTFLKKLWEIITTPLPDLTEDDYDDRFDRVNKPKDNSSWCPFCGYSGNADELRCHLLNDHKQMQ